MTALLALLPLIGKLVPALIPTFGTPVLGNVLSKAGEIAQTIFGTTNAEQIELMIQQDKSKAQMFTAQLESATQTELAYLADVQSARQQTVALTEQGSSIAWGAPIVSVLVTIGFFAVLGIFMLFSRELPDFQKNVLLILIGILGQAFGQVVSYWLGSSKGSKDKDVAITALAGAATATTREIASTAAAAAAAPAAGKMFR